MKSNDKMDNEIRQFLNDFSQASFEGYSVYDAFNSQILKFISKANVHIINVLITQFFKRFPLNVRWIFGVKKTVNPKILGLALKCAVLAGDQKLIER
jgi:hypothetical protein